MDIVYSVPITISPVSFKINANGEFTHNDIYCAMPSQIYEMVVLNNRETSINVTEYLTDPDRYIGNYYVYIDTCGTSEKFEYWLKDSITLFKFPDGNAITTAWMHLNPVKEVTEDEVKEQINKLYEDIQNCGCIYDDIIGQHLKIVEQMAKEVKFK